MHHIPVFVDKTLLWALTIWYAIFAVWGIVAFYFGIKTISITAGESFGTWYALIVFLASAFVVSLPIFPDGKMERLEKWGTILWLAIVSIYPITLAYQTIINYDDSRAALTVLSLAYLVLPVWRFTFLFRKHRKVNVDD